VRDRLVQSKSPRGVLWAGVVFVAGFAAFFAALQAKAPYYFLQDDNRDYTLPLWVESTRSLLERGQVGQFNFYQSLGMPLLSGGQSGGLNPATYLAVSASQLLLGHPYGAIDAAVLLYFSIGGLGWLYLGSRLKLSPFAGLFAAVTWCFGAFTVYVTVSWILMAPLVAWLPWTVGLLLSLYHAPRLRTLVALSAVHALLFFAGYVPWLILLAVFEPALVVAMLWQDRKRHAVDISPGRRLSWLLPLPLLSAAFSAPLLLPMWHQMKESAYRSGAMDFVSFAHEVARPAVLLNGALAPFWRLYSTKGTTNGFLELASPPAVTHFGYLALAAVLLPLARRWAPKGDRAATRAFALLGALALVWAMGWLTPVLWRTPVLNRLRWPFRLLAFALFFLAGLAAAGFDAWRARVGSRWRERLAVLAIGIHAVNLAAVNLAHDRHGFFQHSDPVPLRAPSYVAASKGRVLAMGLLASFGGNGPTADSVGFDYATLFRIFQFAGYETMMPLRNAVATGWLNHAMPVPTGSSYVGPPQDLPIAYLRLWGVRWYTVTPWMLAVYQPVLERNGMVWIASTPGAVVFRDDAARPLAFWTSTGRDDGLLWHADAGGLSIESQGAADDEITLAFLSNPFFEARIDGRRLDLGRNRLGQVTFPVSRGRHVVRVAYADPYLTLGLLVAACGVVLAGAAGAHLNRRGTRRLAEPAESPVPAAPRRLLGGDSVGDGDETASARLGSG
jgi:hypothetical protein